METATATTVEVEMRRVADVLEDVEALTDAAARQVDGLLHLRNRLTAARRLLDRACVVIDDAHRAERSDNVSLPRTLAWSLPLPFAFLAAGFAVDQPWLVLVMAFVCTYGVVAVAGHAFASTVVRSMIHRKELHHTSLPELTPADVDVPADALTSSPSAYAKAQLLMRCQHQQDVPWRAKVRLGRAAAAVVGVPGARYLSMFRPAAALPALQHLVSDLDELVRELERRPYGRRAAEHGIEHYLRARAVLVHAYRHLSCTADDLLTAGERVMPRRMSNSGQALLTVGHHT